jgi:hypothetical protein
MGCLPTDICLTAHGRDLAVVRAFFGTFHGFRTGFGQHFPTAPIRGRIRHRHESVLGWERLVRGKGQCFETVISGGRLFAGAAGSEWFRFRQAHAN